MSESAATSLIPPPRDRDGPYSVTFVCTGNICRSPMADVITRALLDDDGLGDRVQVSSSGVDGWHVGEGADPRAVDALERHGYDGSLHRSRLFDAAAPPADLVVALDASHVRALGRMSTERVIRLRDFDPRVDGDGPSSDRDVADPYYGTDDDFDTALATIERCCRVLVKALAEALPAEPEAGRP